MDCSWETQAFVTGVQNLPQELQNILYNGTNPEYLAALSLAALDQRYTDDVSIFFEDLLPDLCAKWRSDNYIAVLSAFARILPVAPHLAELAEQILKGSRGNGDLLQNISRDDFSDSDSIHELLLGVFRLLTFDNSTFAQLVRPARLCGLLLHESKSIRYLAIRILCLYVPASDVTLESMLSKYIGEQPVHGPWEGKTIDYFFLSLWESKRLKDVFNRLNVTRNDRRSTPRAGALIRLIDETSLAPVVRNMSGTLLIRSSDVASTRTDQFVLTVSTKKNIGALAAALLNPEPILLTGPAGVGKTTLVRHVAGELDRLSNMVTLHLNEQTDLKTLIGIYTTGSTPGSFQWQPGVLSRAVEEGRWLFIEDLDRAPNDVMGTILPLIERRELLIPNRDTKIQAPRSFRIVATMRSHLNFHGDETVAHSTMLGNRLWRRIQLESPGLDELANIIQTRFPVLENVIPQIMQVYEALRPNNSVRRGTRFTNTRPVSSRDLFKWCRRIQGHFETASQGVNMDLVSDTVMDDAFLEAVDCFASSVQDHGHRKFLTSTIAEKLHVDPQRLHHLVTGRSIPYKLTENGGSQVLRIGRVSLSRTVNRQEYPISNRSKIRTPFATDLHTTRLLERIAASIRTREPVLLVGETGLGKTTAVQHIAESLGHKLVVINLSQQSETGDLLGGFKPINVRNLVIPLKDEFDGLFRRTFSSQKNQDFVKTLGGYIAKSQWKRSIKLWKVALEMVEKAHLSRNVNGQPTTVLDEDHPQKKRKVEKAPSIEDLSRWKAFALDVENLERQLSSPTDAFAFSFVEGNLIKAVRDGDWVLLDEINLATIDTLECLSDLLEDGTDSQGSILLTETGTLQRIKAHHNFRIFGAMNPATDVGKKDLPNAFRSRFTEIYVDSPDKDVKSLTAIVETYMSGSSRHSRDSKVVPRIVSLYQEIQDLVEQGSIIDGSGQRPHYSLRTLTRAIRHATQVAPRCNLGRGIYEGFLMCFLTCLDGSSELIVLDTVKKALFENAKSAAVETRKPLRKPDTERPYVEIVLSVDTTGEGKRMVSEYRHWLPRGQFKVEESPEYIITPYVRRNLENLVRAVSTEKYPVLIQGPTSAGKTSMVEYLAKISGNKFVRINNHEHTDLQEYIGTYISTADGRLVFQDGVLIQALRNGYWVVLDELNLAPSDVLEALNRLLDDNRELLIPETQELVKPHPDFMLFATQNPAGPYGGRKVLSRAFRNRFLELHFEDIPVQELNIILARRSKIPESWCGLVVEVYKRLSQLRQKERIFEHNSFATLRDLFRWTMRSADSLHQLAINGYMLLAEKVRSQEEKVLVQDIIEKTMSRKGVKVQIDDNHLYKMANLPQNDWLESNDNNVIVWTKAMRRLFVLVSNAILNNEPVLLVGDTGCGKTTICQILALAMSKVLHIVNAQQNTETGDIIGAQRPVRNQAATEGELLQDLRMVFSSLQLRVDWEASTLDDHLRQFDALSKEQWSSIASEIRERLQTNRTKRRSLFEWHDGSLVTAMRTGQFYLLDEISLADDSVLERMNSVLDPHRTILLAEKGSTDSLVVAQQGFQFFATMNPGGDFGKKELSPALRNRFTEIWVPAMSDHSDVLSIVEAKLKASARQYASTIVDFAQWFNIRFGGRTSSSVSIRDILAWIEFVNISRLDTETSMVHGAALVYLDTLGANPSALVAPTTTDSNEQRLICLAKLTALLGFDSSSVYQQPVHVSHSETYLKIGLFQISSLGTSEPSNDFKFSAPTTKLNAMRVIRALQLTKPILLEGNPGVGKTSLVTAIAKAVGKPLLRLNLSEQTDLMDLFGSDVPVENEDAGHFAWRDGPFLSAMKSGAWVLLDEMNLASQSVLEGLNACLDHRGEVYIAELDQIFPRHADFRLFAAQNPHLQGGGRKGLPVSFVNRFTVVYADVLRPEDHSIICRQLFPQVQDDTPKCLTSFISDLEDKIFKRKLGVAGSPWEFNIRDILRLLQLTDAPHQLFHAADIHVFLRTLFSQCFRNPIDERIVKSLYTFYFPSGGATRDQPYMNVSADTIQVGVGLMRRKQMPTRVRETDFVNIRSRLPLVESLLICIQRSWPVILTGPSGTGKSKILESLASLAGVTLDIFSMNGDIDATDLVGGYEQVDMTRKLQAFLRKTKIFLRQAANDHLSASAPRTTALREVLDTYHEVLVEPNRSHSLESIRALLIQDMEARGSAHTAQLLRECEELISLPETVNMGKFEWVDGSLVKALQHGNWLLLDNANLCSASVLDRLNSLLEPEGSMIVNENCFEDGSPRIIKPHPDFRIFLTVDPHYGELSRAMRNRAVELYLPPLQDSDPIGLTGNPTNSPALESCMSRFQQFQALIDPLKESEVFKKILEHHIDNTSLSDQVRFPSFCSQAELGLLPRTTAEILNSNLRSYDAIPDLPKSWSRNITQYYQSLQKELKIRGDFSFAQSIYPLSNQPLLAYSRLLPTFSFEPMWLAGLYDLCSDLKKGELVMSTSHPRLGVQTTKSRLQWSIQSASMETGPKDPTYGFALFLVQSQAVLSKWASTMAELSSGSLYVFNYLRAFRAYWWSLSSAVTSPYFARALLPSLQKLGGKNLETTLQDDEQTILLKKEIMEILDSTLSSTILTSGQGMERLWIVFRPNVPKTLNQLQALLNLENLADRFDELVWEIKAPVLELNSLRMSIGEAIELGHHSEVNILSLFQELEHNIDELVLNMEPTNQRTSPFFQVEFEGICQMLDLHLSAYPEAIDAKSKEEATITAFLAHRPTRTVSMDNDSIDSQLLHNFSNYSGCFSRHKEAVAARQDMHRLLAEKIANIGTASFANLKLLQIEISALGEILARQTRKLTSTQDVLIQKWLDQVSSRMLDSQHHHEGSHATRTHENDSTMSNQLTQDLITISLEFIRLYVPDRPFDPILDPTIEKKFYNERRTGLDFQLEALHSVEDMQTGMDVSMRLDIVDKEIRTLGEEPQVPAVARPVVSQLPALQREFDSVLRVVSRLAHESKFIDVRSRSDIRENVSQIISRLKKDHRPYGDLTTPLINFLCCLQVGLLRIEIQASERNQDTGLIDALFDSTPFMSAKPGFWKSLKPSASELNLHTLATFKIVRAVEDTNNWPISRWQGVMETFHNYFLDWKSQLQQDKRDAAVASNLYQYRGNDDTDDEDVEEALLMLFPNSEEQPTAEDSSKARTQQNLQNVSSTLPSLHIDMFGYKPPVSAPLQSLLKSSVATFTTLTKTVDKVSDPTGMRKLLPTILLNLHQNKQLMGSAKIPIAQYNIYTDSNAYEISRFVDLIHNIQHRFRQIQMSWPEHSTLRNVLEHCDMLLNFQIESPIMKFLPSAEKLHAEIAEWQIVASNEFSAANYHKELTDMLIHWRQLELSTWSQLLNQETTKCNEQAKSWWFIAYENVLAVLLTLDETELKSGNYIQSLTETIDRFITSSASGQYSVKLRILESLLGQMKIISLEKNHLKYVHVALSNLVDFRSHFEPFVLEELRKGRQVIEKELRDVIKLASWKDRNIDALRQSAKTSRLRLLKLVKKYRNLLNRPVEPLLKVELPEPAVSELQIPSKDAETVNTTALELCERTASEWNIRPDRYKNIHATLLTMRRKVRSAVDSEMDGATYLKSFLDNVTTSIRSLRDATPATRTEETVPLIKHLMSRKRKLLADTLKELRQAGLKRNPGSNITVLQDSLAKVLLKLPIAPTEPQPARVRDCRVYLYKTLLIMPEVRHAAIEHSGDLNSAEVARSIGYLESLLALTVKQHSGLITSFEVMSRMSVLIKQIVALWDPKYHNIVVSDLSVQSAYERLESALAWLSKIIETAVDVMTAQAELGSIDVKVAVELLRGISEKLQSIRTELQAQEKLPSGLSSTLQGSTLTEARKAIDDTKLNVTQLANDYPDLEVVLAHILPWTKLDNYGALTNGDVTKSSSLAKFNSQLYSNLDMVLGSIQDVELTLQSSSKTVSETSWLIEEDNVRSAAVAALHMPQITFAIQNLLEELQYITKEEDLQSALTSLASTQPIIQRFEDTCAQILNTYAILHHSVAETSYRLSKAFLNTATQGFCSPQEKSNESEGKSDKLESGTGLGDGEGAEDISKDIGDDEDLSELAQEPNETDPTQDMEAQEDAVDIEGEMHGQAKGDNELEQEDKDVSQDGESEAEGLEEDATGSDAGVAGGDADEGVGEVDDQGPSAVDEKLWDQAGDEDAKEKDGENHVGEKGQDQTEASKDQKSKNSDIATADEADMEDADEGEDEGVAEDLRNSDAGSNHGSDADPSYMDEAERLELPDELQLDGDQQNKDQSPQDDFDSDLGSDLNASDDEGEYKDANEEMNDAGPKVEEERETEEQDGNSEQESDALKELDPQDITADQHAMDQDNDGGQALGAGQVADTETSHNEERDEKDMTTGDDALDSTQEFPASANSAQRQSGFESQPSETQQAMGDAPSKQTQSENTPDRAALRQLGSTLEKWHRQQRRILERAPNDEKEYNKNEDQDMVDADFEHALDESHTDTQALGASSKEEQARALDESLAIPDQNRKFDEEQFESPKEATEDVQMEDRQDDVPTGNENHQQIPSQVLAGNTSDADTQKLDDANPDEPQDEPVSDLEDNLSTIRLQTSPSTPQDNTTDPLTTWQGYESRTATLAQLLTSHLRLILAPTLATKFRGDFRTGKRLSLKRIIPYIASGYKRDKIWLRRSVPSKRAYQVLLAIDDSKSMADNGSAALAFECLAVLARALSLLEAGELGVLGFGETVAVAHDLSAPWSADAGARCVEHFGFRQGRTDVRLLMRESIDLLQAARLRAGGRADLWQLQLVVSDGICEDHEAIRRLLLRAQDERIMVVFVVVDATGEGRSILELEKVDFVEGAAGEMEVRRRKYLDTFPFRYFLVVRDVNDLPGVLAAALRQWFQEVAER